MKFDLGKVIGIAGMVHGLVVTTQSKLRDKSGKEKRDAVVEQVRELLPIVEGISGKDLLDDATYLAAIDELIALEKAVAVARAKVSALILDIKSR
jgi:hypothetical protein